MAKGKTPSVARSGNKIIFSWSPEKKYDDQKIEVGLYYSGSWHDTEHALTKSSKKYEVNIDISEWWPVGSRKLANVRARLKYKDGGKWSSWGSWKKFDILVPKSITANSLICKQASNDETFAWSWSVPSSNTDKATKYWRSYYVWETVLMPKGKAADWSLVDSQTLTRLNAINETDILVNAPSRGYFKNATKVEITERSDDIEAGKVRYFRVRSAGPQGDSSATRTTSHSLGKNSQVAPSKTDKASDGKTEVEFDGTSGENGTTGTIWIPEMPVSQGDKIDILYAITAPYVSTTLDGDWVRSTVSLPNNFTGWQTLKTITPTGNAFRYSFNIDGVITEDTCLFMRVDTTHDNLTTRGSVIMFDQHMGHLSSPTLVSFQPNTDTQEISVTVKNNSELAANGNRSFIAIYLQTEDGLDTESPIGIIPYQNSEVTRTFPATWEGGTQVSVTVKAFVADYNRVTNEIDNIKMESVSDWDSQTTAQLPTMPDNVTVTPFVTEEEDLVAKVEWDWTWTDANIAEISWSESRYAWEATSDPSNYQIVDSKANYRYVTGLNAGNYYFRVRLLKSDKDTAIYGPYCDIIGPVKVSTAPNKPTLTLSIGEDSTVGLEDEITAYWGYSNSDGTTQRDAKFATVEDGVYTELDSLFAGTSTKKTFTPSEVGWENGNTYNLCVKVISSVGESSVSWSNPVAITVAPMPILTVIGIGGETDELRPIVIPADGPEDAPLEVDYGLVKMPLEFTVTGCGKNGSARVIIERDADFVIDMPDDLETTFFEGETIFSEVYRPLVDQDGDSIDVLIDNLPSGAMLNNLATYRLRVSITDQYKQTVETSYPFRVYWDKSATIPDANIVLNKDRGVVFITPTADTAFDGYSVSNATGDFIFTYPEEETLLIDFSMDENGNVVATYDDRVDVELEDGYILASTDASIVPSGDYCQIWRLSADKPQLIVDHGIFGETYVDLYPTFGPFGGYRIVYVTKYGDNVTEENYQAWSDYSMNYNRFYVAIEFDDEVLEFPGDISLSHGWQKDFQLTTYLGGSVEGDWNPGVQRTGSINGTIPVEKDAETLYLLRKLADYPGVCHVRTPDGSNFYANIEVKDDREERWVNKKSKISLSYTRVDPEESEAITYDEWIEGE